MIKRRLWLFDVEGTLTGVGGRGFDYLLPKRLAQLMKMGSMVGLCTSQSVAYARVIHALFNLNGPVVGDGGKSWWLATMGESVKQEPLPAEDKGDGVRAVCDKMEVPLSAVSYVGNEWNDWPAFEKTLAGGGRAIFVGEDKELERQLGQLGGEIVKSGAKGLARWLLDEV